MTPPTNTEGAVTDVAAIAAKLTEAQRAALLSDWREPDGSMIWDLAGIGLANCVGLTMLGLAVKFHLTEQGVTAS